MEKDNQKCNIIPGESVTRYEPPLLTPGASPGRGVTQTAGQTGVEGHAPLSPKVVLPVHDIMSTHTANLGPLFPPQEPPKACTPNYMVIQCGCGRRVVPSTCMSLNCTVCREHVGRRRADAVVRRLKYHRFKPVIYTVFTVPLAVRERFYDKKEWQKARLKIWKVLKSKFGARYGCEASHPVGDPALDHGEIIADTNGEVFHPHLNFLWLQFNGWSPFIDVEMLRKEWARILKVDVVDVWTNYSGSPGRVIKWARYIFRTFPGMHKWTGSARWYGKYPRARKQQPPMCTECGYPIIVLGTLSHWDVDDWMAHEHPGGIDPPWLDDSKISRYKPRISKNTTQNQHGNNTQT